MTSHNEDFSDLLDILDPDKPSPLLDRTSLTRQVPVSQKLQESVRIRDALLSLSSPLYQKKAEQLGMKEYLKQHCAGYGH